MVVAEREMPVLMRKVLQWLWFFLRNRDYRRYCWARRVKRDDLRAELEGQYPGLAELYDDWGDIHAVDLFNDTAAQSAWWRTRAQLFIDLPTVAWVDDPKTYVHRPGHMLVEVPLMDTKAATVRVFERFAQLPHQHRVRAQAESTKPAVRLSMQPRPGPKYTFHPDGSHLSAATKRAIAKAIYVDGLRHRRKDDGKPLSITDSVIAIKQDPKNPFGWSLTEADRRDLVKGVFKKGLFAGSEITLVKRARKDFDAYVRNTIHGRFPDNS